MDEDIKTDKKKQGGYWAIGFVVLALLATGATINNWIEWRGRTTLTLVELKDQQVALESEMQTASDTLEDAATALNRNTALVNQLLIQAQATPQLAQERIPSVDPEPSTPSQPEHDSEPHEEPGEQ